MSRLILRRVASRLRRTDPRPAPTDAELLARFADAHDEGAFAELVRRHGGLVRGTARRCIGDPHAAEDVYQATFLVLARKAGAVRWSATVGPWLHAAAVRLARKARAHAAAAPAPVPADIPSPAVDPVTAAEWGEVCRALDEELAGLPEVIRAPLVLCYLQGRTRDEAAQALGCALAMLKRRLERGRKLLRDRLARRGVALPAAGIGVLAADLPVDASEADATARAAVAFAEGGPPPSGAVALVGASRTLQAKAVVTLLAVGMLACGVAFAAFSRSVAERADTPPAAPPAVADKVNADAQDEPLPPGAVVRLGSTRLRPGGSVYRMAFSPDGTKLAAWSGDSHTTDALTIWDTKTGRLLRRIDLPGAGVDLLAWLADGRGIALVRSDYE